MRSRVLALLLLLFFRCALGYWWTTQFNLNKEVVISGKVINIDHKDSECIMLVGNIYLKSENICAAVVGDEIRAIGKLERRVIDSFRGRLWLVSKQIETINKTQKSENSKIQNRGLVNNFREFLVFRFKKFVPEPEAGLMAGIVLGYKNDISHDFYKEMVKSGTIHIAVASGYNILLVGGVILSLCFWLVKRPQAVIWALIGELGYAILAGGDSPVVRAVWMAFLMYLGQVFGRAVKAVWILLVTAWVMLLINPSLMVEVSFQLSVMASFGLMSVEPWVKKQLTKWGADDLGNFLSGIGLLTTLSTMLMTLPILWWHFGRLSLIGILSNILILPLIPPLMILGVGVLVVPNILGGMGYALAHWVVLLIHFFGV